MGFFGSSRKKPRDPFHATVDQYRRRTPATRLTEIRSGQARHLSTEYYGGGGPASLQDGPISHPYGQPGFGFYSGENLTAHKPRQQEPRRSLSMDVGFNSTPQGVFSDQFGRDLPYTQSQEFLGPAYKNNWEYDAERLPWLDINPWTESEMRYEDPYKGQYERPQEQYKQFTHPTRHDVSDHLPRTRASPLDRSTSMNRRWLPPQRHHQRPVFDQFRPFGSSPVPNPYTAPVSDLNFSMHCHPSWNAYANRTFDPFPGMRTVNPPSRPPGSYERLRPPHLQQANSRTGSGRGTSSSSSRMGDFVV